MSYRVFENTLKTTMPLLTGLVIGVFLTVMVTEANALVDTMQSVEIALTPKNTLQ